MGASKYHLFDTLVTDFCSLLIKATILASIIAKDKMPSLTGVNKGKSCLSKNYEYMTLMEVGGWSKSTVAVYV
jgi:hypothetical protein